MPTHYKCICNVALAKPPERLKHVGKVHPRTVHEGPDREQMYRFTFLWPRCCMGVGSQRHDPAALPPGRTRYPLNRRLGGPQARSRRVRKMSPTLGFDPWTVQPVASRYADWIIPAHKHVGNHHIIKLHSLKQNALVFFNKFIYVKGCYSAKKIYFKIDIFFPWCKSLYWPRAFSLLRLQDHTQSE